MPDLLTNLIERTLGAKPVVRPLIRPMFAPAEILVEEQQAEAMWTSQPVSRPEERSSRPTAPPGTKLSAERDVQRDVPVPPASHEVPITPRSDSFPESAAISDSLPLVPLREESVHKLVSSEPRSGAESGRPRHAIESVPHSPSEMRDPPVDRVLRVEARLVSPAAAAPPDVSLARPKANGPAQNLPDSEPNPQEFTLLAPGGRPQQSGNETHKQELEVRPLQDRGIPSTQSPEPVIPVRPGELMERSVAPTIRVTIGRIEVRAVTPPAPQPRVKPPRSRPALTLDEYLKQRNDGKR